MAVILFPALKKTAALKEYQNNYFRLLSRLPLLSTKAIKATSLFRSLRRSEVAASPQDKNKTAMA
jgi:hypothetical protein